MQPGPGDPVGRRRGARDDLVAQCDNLGPAGMPMSCVSRHTTRPEVHAGARGVEGDHLDHRTPRASRCCRA